MFPQFKEFKVGQFNLTDWFVAQELEANVLPAKIVPPPTVDVLNKPIFEIEAVAVTNEFAEAKPAVNCAVPESGIELVTACRPAPDEPDTSPDREVAFEAG